MKKQKLSIDFSKMTLREKIYQTFVVDQHTINLEGNAKNFFAKYPVGGMYYAAGWVPDLGILMSESISGADYINECRKLSQTPLLVCADGTTIGDEGYTIISALGASRDEKLAYDNGKVVGLQSNINDIDWVLGPCTDLSFCRCGEHTSMLMTDDPDLNARLYTELVKGTQDRGVCATVKHFPGQGSYHVNFHAGPGKNTLTKEEWDKTYGHTYRKAFEAGCMCVMTSHIYFPAVCKEGDNGYPPICTFSSKINIDLLKNELGFQGAIVTDALTMGGMACGSQALDAAQAFASGADILLWPPMETCEIIAERIESGEIPMSRLEDALTRIARMRAFVDEHRVEVPDREESLAFAKDVRQRAREAAPTLLCDLWHKLPLRKEEKILVIGNAREGKAMEETEQFATALKNRGYDATFQKYLLTCYQEQVDEQTIDRYDRIIFVLNHPFEVSIEDHIISTTWASHHVRKDKKIIVNFSSPYLADDYYPDEPCVINTNLRLSPESIEVVLDRMEGKKPFTGISPVKLEMRGAISPLYQK